MKRLFTRRRGRRIREDVQVHVSIPPGFEREISELQKLDEVAGQILGSQMTESRLWNGSCVGFHKADTKDSRLRS